MSPPGRLSRRRVKWSAAAACAVAVAVGMQMAPSGDDSPPPPRPPPARPAAAPFSLGGTAPQVTILSPIDVGTLFASPQQAEPHHTPFGGDWALDAEGAGATYARFADPSDDLVLTMEGEFEPCGGPDSGGRAVTIGVSVGGTRIGTVVYAHLASVEVAPGVIPNGARLGDMVTDPPARSHCWGNVHTHVEPRNIEHASCFLARHRTSDLDATSAMGVLGGAWTDGHNQLCPAGRLDSVKRVGGGVRLDGWALNAGVPGEFVPLRVLIDRRPAAEAAADTSSRDAGRHGFSVTVPLDPGSHNVCVTAIGIAGAADVPLPDCRQV